MAINNDILYIIVWFIKYSFSEFRVTICNYKTDSDWSSGKIK